VAVFPVSVGKADERWAAVTTHIGGSARGYHREFRDFGTPADPRPNMQPPSLNIYFMAVPH
jgi:hypothetical protein